MATSKAAVICAKRVVESSKTINDCELHVKTIIAASGFALVQLTYNN